MKKWKGRSYELTVSSKPESFRLFLRLKTPILQKLAILSIKHFRRIKHLAVQAGRARQSEAFILGPILE